MSFRMNKTAIFGFVCVMSGFALIYLVAYRISLKNYPSPLQPLDYIMIAGTYPPTKEKLNNKAKKSLDKMSMFSASEYAESSNTDNNNNNEIKINEKVSSSNYEKKDWNDYNFIKYENSRVGDGEHGRPLILDSRFSVESSKLYEKNGYSGLVSNFLSLNRSTVDLRHEKCLIKKYLVNLTDCSVILVYYEENLSTLLRSVHSIINRSPKSLLKEIILVDDGTDSPELNQQLPQLLKKNDYYKNVRRIKLKNREGLIEARLTGARAALGSILVFMDAHSEVGIDWLPPLLEPIVFDFTTATCPFIDVIDAKNFEIRKQDDGARGAFDWSFYYKRLPLFEKDLVNPDEPFESPVMAGGYFAINKEWFWKLGGYDPGIRIWGGEQYEISFKIWQCHGRLLDIPCSRIAHVYRIGGKGFPDMGIGNFVAKNYRRVAEVWMDDYKKYLYKNNPGWLAIDPGDLTLEKKIRKDLKCKSFDWFMTNVLFDLDQYYPMEPPRPLAYGKLQSYIKDGCVDSNYGLENSRVKIVPCENLREGNITYTKNFQLKAQDSAMCFDLSVHEPGSNVQLYPCHGQKGNQYFKYDVTVHHIKHVGSSLCLESNGNNLLVNSCNNTLSQKWNFDHINTTAFINDHFNNH